eukprot:scpid21658/ scgid31394/ 
MAHGVSSADGHHAAALPTKPAPARSRPTFGGSSGAHASSFLVSGQSAAKIQCAVCDAPHHTWSCDIFKSESPSRRWETAKKKGLCYRCLGTGHRGTSCTRNRKCGVSGCSQTHHQLLHDRQPQQKRNLPEAAMSSDVASSSAPTASISTRGATTPAIEPASINCSIQACNITEGEPDLGEDRPRGVPSVSLRILPVSLVHEGERIQVNAMLDDCSTTTYITTAAAGQLRVAGRPQQASVSLLSGLTETFVTTPVNITVESADGTFQSKLTALTIESIASNLKAVDWANAAAQWDHLRDVPFTALTEESVDLLIGSDHSELHSCWEEVNGKPGEPLARRTPLGWTCIGAVLNNDDRPTRANSTYCGVQLNRLYSCLQRFWEVDQDGPWNMKDRSVKAEVAQSMRQLDGAGNEIHLQWNGQKSKLPDNYSMVFSDCVEPGPRLQREILEVLLGFRRNSVTIVCDIREMYLQIRNHSEDQPYLRFLWRPPERNTQSDVYQMYQELPLIWAAAGMKAWKRLSDTPAVLAEIPAEDRLSALELKDGSLPTMKTLGDRCKMGSDRRSFAVFVRQLLGTMPLSQVNQDQSGLGCWRYGTSSSSRHAMRALAVGKNYGSLSWSRWTCTSG